MADFFSVVWTIVSFIIGLAWSVVWFILRDLLSTVVWIGIAIWIGFVLRYRSFTHGSVALLRYGRHGAMLLWRWVRGKPSSYIPAPLPEPVTKIVKEYKNRIPFGYTSVSEQLNVLLIALLVLMARV